MAGAMVIRATFKGIPMLMSATKQRKYMKNTFQHIGETWIKDFMPKHFTAEGARSYRMKQRVTKNIRTGQIHKGLLQRNDGTWRYVKLAPDARPLVWSGDTKKAAETKHKIKATSKGVTLRFPGTQNLNRQVKGNADMNLAEEFRVVLKKEQKELSKTASVWLTDQINEDRQKVTVTYK